MDNAPRNQIWRHLFCHYNLVIISLRALGAIFFLHALCFIFYFSGCNLFFNGWVIWFQLYPTPLHKYEMGHPLFFCMQVKTQLVTKLRL